VDEQVESDSIVLNIMLSNLYTATKESGCGPLLNAPVPAVAFHMLLIC